MSTPQSARIESLKDLMAEAGVDAVLLAPGSDLLYLSGYEATVTERLTVLVVPVSGEPKLVVPELEAARVREGPFEMISWPETKDPVQLAAGFLDGVGSVAISDDAWADFVIRFQAELPTASWSQASLLTRGLRMTKNPDEIRALREAARQADAVAGRIPGEVRFSGRTEREISRDIKDLLLEEGHDHAEFAIVGSGPNGASPHHDASDRQVREGDVVVVDFGGRLAGYCSDTTRTFVVGQPTAEQLEVHQTVRRANEAGRAAVRPGVECQEVDRAARAVIDDAGYGEYFIHRTGHGIGLDVHEHPYMVEGNDLLLKEGMTFSIEPGIYLPGRFGVRIEDIVACAPEGQDSLNQSNRDLVTVS